MHSSSSTRLGRSVVGLVLILVLSGNPTELWAQGGGGRDWNQEHDPYWAAIGLAAGYSSGTGLSFRWPAFPQVMMGLTGAIWKQDGNTDWNLGLDLHLVLRQAHRTRFYVGASAAADRDGGDSETWWNASLGGGMEFIIVPRVVLKADLGFTWRQKNDDILPLPQLGIYYYF